MSKPAEVYTWSNISATASPSQVVSTDPRHAANTFALRGGYFSLDVVATWGGGTVELGLLAIDGATFVNVMPTSFSANGTALLNLPPGVYKLIITTATAVYARLVSIPND
jgi:hypothetical protein